VLRPFCVRAAVEPRGTSRRLQRVLVDFGSEESFARAAQRVQEHYGVEVALGRLRRHTLEHGAQMSALEIPPPRDAAAVLVTQMDGSLIPLVAPSAHGADRRKGKQLHWREVRLCLARAKDSVTPCYGATLGSVGVAGALWRQTAVAAGLGEATHVHGLGDGADWLTTQFQEQFGAQGDYLVDFWHVSEYLGAAATAIQPEKAQPWRRRQQGRLLANHVSAVLRALAPHVEPETQTQAGRNWTTRARGPPGCRSARAKSKAATGMSSSNGSNWPGPGGRKPTPKRCWGCAWPVPITCGIRIGIIPNPPSTDRHFRSHPILKTVRQLAH
jgi:hypothetical protein